MAKKIKDITAYDCLAFDNDLATADVLHSFMKSQSNNVFRFSDNYHSDDESKLAEYNYRENNWRAGRFVGEAIFNHNKTDYKITIKPRFGEKLLFRMLEEIFNIRFTHSASQNSKSTDFQHYIKRIIAFIWVQKLANANIHGVPKTQVKREFQGQVIRGRLDVRRSIIPLHRSGEVVSTYREKEIDKHIAQLIFQAYQILKTDFEIGNNIPDSAREAINQIYSAGQKQIHISESDYKNIKYKDIYLSWKPLVDFSWDIVKRKQLSLKQDQAQNGFGFFIDMAEVWEQYLRSILKKNLLPLGWRYVNEKQIAYKDYFFRRELIPDLVFQKDNEVAVWDAKYKSMKGLKDDVDRSDFFQIHTYIQYQLNHKTVKTGGLLYPISKAPKNFLEYQSPYLIQENGVKMKFIIDGVELEEMNEQTNPVIQEQRFIDRILSHIKD